VQQLTEVSLHAHRLVLLELCNGTAKQRNDGALHITRDDNHQINKAVQEIMYHVSHNSQQLIYDVLNSMYMYVQMASILSTSCNQINL